MNAQRTRVYVAYQPRIGDIPGHRGNIRTQRLVVESYPAVALYPSWWTLLGTVDANTAWQIEALGDEATLPKFVARITPLGIQPAEAEAPRLPRGRRRLTDDQVRADLDRALAALAAERRITQPTWDQLAGAHDGLDWQGMTVDGLRKRRKGHPIPFSERVPHLTE